MKTKVKPAGENEVELSVEVPRRPSSGFERTVRIAREFQIPGFRKGRVPRA